MAKLKSLAPRLEVLKPRVAVPTRAVAEQMRNEARWRAQPWRQWYGTAAWKRLRWSILTRDLFTCQMCKRIETDTSRLVCDHIDPHGGDREKFWAGPFQTLCCDCHDGAKQRIDRQGRQASLRPKWLKPSIVPLTIVCGAPASGKSHYVRMRAAAADMVIDLDAIVADMSGGPLHGWDRDRWLHPALFRRNDMLGSLSRPGTHKAAWFIVSEPKPFNRQWWDDTLKPAEIVVIETPEAQCIANAANDSDRPEDTASGIVSWWFDYRRRPGDRVVSFPF